MEEGAVIKHDIKNAAPTGSWSFMRPEVNKEKCVGCQTCVPFCPDSAIDMAECPGFKGKKADIDYDFCKGCGVCAQVCPYAAITMKKK